MARELLIQDGKLTSDLDADHKTIKNLEGFAALDESGKVPESQLPPFPGADGYKPKQTAVPDPTASGNAVSFIDTISQDANGVITPTKKTVATAVASSGGTGGSAGLMTAADKEKLAGIAAGADVTPTPIAPSQDSADEGKAADAYATGMALSAKAEARSGTHGNIAVYAEYSTLLEDSGYAPSDFAPADALNGKANKVANAISGNLAGLDSYGDLTDSGYAPSDFATPADIPSASSTSPSMDGTAAVGVSDDYARADHVHPSDTNKADASALRYAMPAAAALVAQNDAATLVCADRAVTNATIASGFSTLNLTFPAEVSGYVRDFYLRITVAAGQSAPSISVPQGVTIENAGGAVPEIADGEASAAATTLVWFSETAPGIFTAKSETVKAVA